MKRKTREEWITAIERWTKSGMTADAFTQREGINAHTFKNWRWRLNTERKRRGEPTKRVAPKTPLAFVEIMTPPREQATAPFEVSLRSGDRILVPARFEVSALRELIAALGVC